MKKSIIISFFLIASLTFSSCKKKQKQQNAKKTTEKLFSVVPKTTTINWIAYKTTGKVPVKGQFTTFTVENKKNGKSVKEALDGLQFNIPISSLFTKDSIRDEKLKKIFFGSMKNTTEIKGTLHFNNETSGSADIVMNGLSQTLPITYFIDGQMVNINAVMNLDNWKAQAAIKALNIACNDLHTGDDGISKTWSEVKIEVVTYLKKE